MTFLHRFMTEGFTYFSGHYREILFEALLGLWSRDSFGSCESMLRTYVTVGLLESAVHQSPALIFSWMLPAHLGVGQSRREQPHLPLAAIKS